MEAQGPQGPPPGWYSDPDGRSWRHWDGAKWSDGSGGTPPQQGAPPPQQEAQSRQETQSRQEAQPRPREAQPGQQSQEYPTYLKVLLGVLLLVAVPIVSCVALRGASKGGDDEFVRELDRKQNTNAITNDQARDVNRETTRGEVESQFGPPLPDQGGSTRGAGNDVCIYYHVKDSRSYDQWRFCFEGPNRSGKLTLKNRFS